MRRASKLAVIAPMAVLAFLAGCTNAPSSPSGTGGTTTTTAPATTAPPTVSVGTLTAASVKSVGQSFHLKVDVTAAGQSMTLTGDVNPAGEATLQSVGATELQAIITGQDVYLKAPAFAALNIPGWLHVDLTKLRADSSLRQSLNPAASLGMLAGATAIRQTSPNNYEGTVDLNLAVQAITDPQIKTFLAALVKEAGPNAAKVPFTAAVDSEGRLVGYGSTITIAGGELKSQLTLSDFGKTVTVTKPPAAEVTEAPAEVYQTI